MEQLEKCRASVALFSRDKAEIASPSSSHASAASTLASTHPAPRRTSRMKVTDLAVVLVEVAHAASTQITVLQPAWQKVCGAPASFSRAGTRPNRQ
ncbi:hypothetical protein MAPG_02113 [Magnaporthiopsis poae ATCC 64411]|uniref:Uncharacterized protein n=1 Tax=Magnaporthiopsis poae (strain ATCC 64411 / 73-15) TaxID=644358 RepID=A0A0C4DQH3_MAGP6|nr:hypothetical protein MAPG_02113 [Magnaporthiopsis poae ATCC 64411]